VLLQIREAIQQHLLSRRQLSKVIMLIHSSEVCAALLDDFLSNHVVGKSEVNVLAGNRAFPIEIGDCDLSVTERLKPATSRRFKTSHF